MTDDDRDALSAASLPPGSLAADYDATLSYWRHLVDVRFRLLALIPTVTGVGVGTLSGSDGATRFAVGVLGLTATLGALVYDLRNSMLHDAAVHRLKQLETWLALPPSVRGTRDGGVFTERPGALKRGPLGIPIKHDVGLALVYASALGGWAALAASGPSSQKPLTGVSLLVGVAVGVTTVWQLRRFDRRDRRLPRPR